MDNNGNDNNNNNNWRPAQADPPPNMDPSADWRNQLPSDSRHRIVNKIMETLKRHLPCSGQDGLQELWRIAVRFEERTYTAATSQADYLRKISLKMLTMETKSQNTIASNLSANSVGDRRNPADSVSMDSTAHPEQSTQARRVIVHPQPPRNLVNPQRNSQAPVACYVAGASTIGVQLNAARATGAQNALPNMVNPNPQQPGAAGSSDQGAANVIKDWRDETYVKIKATKDKYLPRIQQIRQKIVDGLQQHDANPRRENVQHMRRLRLARTGLDEIILFLNVQKANISFNHSILLGRHQRKIRRILDVYYPERPIPYMPYAGFCSKYRSTVRRR